MKHANAQSTTYIKAVNSRGENHVKEMNCFNQRPKSFTSYIKCNAFSRDTSELGLIIKVLTYNSQHQPQKTASWHTINIKELPLVVESDPRNCKCTDPRLLNLTFRASRLFLLMPQASSCSLPRKASSMSMQPRRPDEMQSFQKEV